MARGWYYNVGDIVYIRADLQNRQAYGDYGADEEDERYCCANSNMKELAGNAATIVELTVFGSNNPAYRIDLDGGEWFWVDEMFDLVSAAPISFDDSDIEDWDFFLADFKGA